MSSKEQILVYLQRYICEFKGWADITSVPVNQSWFDFGMDSVDLAGLGASIYDDFGVEIEPDLIYENDTLEILSQYISGHIAGVDQHGNSDDGGVWTMSQKELRGEK